MAVINLVSCWGRTAHKKAHSGGRRELPKANPQRGCTPDGAMEAEQCLCRAASAAGVLLPFAAALYSLYRARWHSQRGDRSSMDASLWGKLTPEDTRSFLRWKQWWILGKDPCKFTAVVWRAPMNTHINCHRSETSGPTCLAGSFFDGNAPRGRMLQIRASPCYPQGLTEEELLAELQEVMAGQHPAKEVTTGGHVRASCMSGPDPVLMGRQGCCSCVLKFIYH